MITGWLNFIFSFPSEEMLSIFASTGVGGRKIIFSFLAFSCFISYFFFASFDLYFAKAILFAIWAFITSGSTYVCHSATAGPWVSTLGSPFSYTKADSDAVSFGFSGTTSTSFSVISDATSPLWKSFPTNSTSLVIFPTSDFVSSAFFKPGDSSSGLSSV